jgi:V/A-type H+-transporting ATPase subunit E
VAYGDLLRALEDEVREQRRALEEGARREAEGIALEGRRLSAAAREEALARAAAAGEAEREKARREAALEEERALLAERRALLDRVRNRARDVLASRSTPALTLRLLEEALADDDGAPLAVTCDPGHGEAVRAWLGRERPAAAPRTRIEERSSPVGGVEVAVGDLLVVDDTLPSRLDRAWPVLEVALARSLLGSDDA